MTATGRRLVEIDPREVAARDEACADGLEEARRDKPEPAKPAACPVSSDRRIFAIDAWSGFVRQPSAHCR